MMSTRMLANSAAVAALMCATAVPAFAQETTSAVRGRITDGSGAAVAGATVSITHVPTGTTVTTLSGPDGYYTARGLRVGGPYTVQATASGRSESSSVQSVGVGAPVTVNIALNANEVEEVVVTAALAKRAENGGPTSNFGLGDIQDLPSLKRDLKDVARLNPFVTLDPSNLDAVIAGGVSNRFNSLTVDGVKQNDDFGLNNNGYPTQRSPISPDAVQALSVNLAPYSVLYNDFQGANINVVTKSGTNDFKGSFLYEYSDEDFIGDKANGQTFTNIFEEKSWAATLGGPIIKDKLFFFLAYEQFDAERGTIAGPVGSGKPVIAGNPTAAIPFITPAQVTQVQDILKNVYGYGVDTESSILNNLALPEEDTKKLVKLDWNITDNHRAAFTWQSTSGTRLIEGNRSSSTQLALYSNYYTKGDDLTVYTAQLNSEWTDNLRTELTATQKEVATLQIPVGGVSGNASGNGDEAAEYGQFSIGANPAVSGTGTRILAGPDNSRHANELENTLKTYRARVFYDLGDNEFAAGVEMENLEVFNLFAQRTEGEFTFNSVADLQSKNLNQLVYQNAIVDANGDGVRNEEDLAAQFDYDTWNFYAQDTLRITPNLSVTAGVRYTQLSQDDQPRANPYFLERYGFSNSENLDGKSVVLPRLSFDWRPDYEANFGAVGVSGLRVTGGLGLFSGGAATVWVSNSFSNTGVLGASVSCLRNATSSACGLAAGTTDNAILAQVTSFADLPTALEALLDPTKPNIINIQRSAGTNGIDPGFQPIQTWKSSVTFAGDLNLGWLGDNYEFTVDYLRGDVEKGILWKDYRGGLSPVAYAPDGRPIYRRNAERGLFVTGVASSDTGSDLVLTNSDQGFQQAWAFSLSKSWDSGFDSSFSYTLTDAKDVNPGTSSVAFSNWAGVATADVNNPGLATSNYEIKHSYKLRLSWTRELWEDNKSNVSLFMEHRSGLPYSFVYNMSGSASMSTFGDGASNRQLFYVPQVDSAGNVTLTSDPIIAYATGFNMAAFNEYLKGVGLTDHAGKISPRNGFRSDDVTRFDLRLSQELPAFVPNGAKLKLFADFINFGNMLNDEWGVLEQVDFPYTAPIVGVAIAGGKYTYSNFQPAVKTLSNSDAPNRSLWQVKFGLRYAF